MKYIRSLNYYFILTLAAVWFSFGCSGGSGGLPSNIENPPLETPASDTQGSNIPDALSPSTEGDTSAGGTQTGEPPPETPPPEPPPPDEPAPKVVTVKHLLLDKDTEFALNSNWSAPRKFLIRMSFPQAVEHADLEDNIIMNIQHQTDGTQALVPLSFSWSADSKRVDISAQSNLPYKRDFALAINAAVAENLELDEPFEGIDEHFKTMTENDVNGDGYRDVFTVEWANDYLTTKNRAYSLAPKNFTELASWMAPEGTISYFKVAGDVNADGYADIIALSTDTAAVLILSGKKLKETSDPMQSIIAKIVHGAQPGENESIEFGIYDGVGDADNDGFDDIIFSSLRYKWDPTAALADNSRIYLLKGKDIKGGAAAPMSVESLTPKIKGAELAGPSSTYHDSLGSFQMALYDRDRDGIKDHLIFDAIESFRMTYDGQIEKVGRVYIYELAKVFNATGSLGPQDAKAVIEGSQPVSITSTDIICFGQAIQVAGDINKDGADDIIIGAPCERAYADTWGNVNQGVVYVYNGKVLMPEGGGAGNQSSALITKIVTASPSTAYFGWSVAPAGDVENDGYADIIIGAPRPNTRAYVYRGAVLSDPATAVFTVNTYRGIVANAYQPGMTNLSAYAYYAAPAADTATAYFGTSITTDIDINGDGRNDLIIGRGGIQPDTVMRLHVYDGSIAPSKEINNPTNMPVLTFTADAGFNMNPFFFGN